MRSLQQSYKEFLEQFGADAPIKKYGGFHPSASQRYKWANGVFRKHLLACLPDDVVNQISYELCLRIDQGYASLTNDQIENRRMCCCYARLYLVEPEENRGRKGLADNDFMHQANRNLPWYYLHQGVWGGLNPRIALMVLSDKLHRRGWMYYPEQEHTVAPLVSLWVDHGGKLTWDKSDFRKWRQELIANKWSIDATMDVSKAPKYKPEMTVASIVATLGDEQMSNAWPIKMTPPTSGIQTVSNSDLQKLKAVGITGTSGTEQFEIEPISEEASETKPVDLSKKRKISWD